MPSLLTRTPAELEPLIPGLSDDDLCACVANWCEGYIQSWDNGRPSWLAPGKHGTGGRCPSYPTDGNAAFRLVEKYGIGVHRPDDDQGRPVLNGSWGSVKHGFSQYINTNPRRAIAECALAVALREAQGD